MAIHPPERVYIFIIQTQYVNRAASCARVSVCMYIVHINIHGGSDNAVSYAPGRVVESFSFDF